MIPVGINSTIHAYLNGEADVVKETRLGMGTHRQMRQWAHDEVQRTARARSQGPRMMRMNSRSTHPTADDDNHEVNGLHGEGLPPEEAGAHT